MEQEKISSKNTARVICEIPMKLPSLNEYINVCRSNPYQASKFKRDIESDIGVFIRRLPRFERPVKIHFHWIEGNKRRDLDNVCYAKKHILDALVKFGKLKDDSRRYVTAFKDTFEYAKEAKVIITIEEVDE
jgi:Holliday junction resolvase RusA-like endonuclease